LRVRIFLGHFFEKIVLSCRKGSYGAVTFLYRVWAFKIGMWGARSLPGL
jgi:hypothetical protein